MCVHRTFHSKNEEIDRLSIRTNKMPSIHWVEEWLQIEKWLLVLVRCNLLLLCLRHCTQTKIVQKLILRQRYGWFVKSKKILQFKSNFSEVLHRHEHWTRFCVLLFARASYNFTVLLFGLHLNLFVCARMSCTDESERVWSASEVHDLGFMVQFRLKRNKSFSCSASTKCIEKCSIPHLYSSGSFRVSILSILFLLFYRFSMKKPLLAKIIIYYVISNFVRFLRLFLLSFLLILRIVLKYAIICRSTMSTLLRRKRGNQRPLSRIQIEFWDYWLMTHVSLY